MTRAGGLLAALLLGGCVATVEEADAPAPQVRASAPDAAVAPPSRVTPEDGDAPPVQPPAAPCVQMPTDVPARLMTRLEYDNTVRDLLGETGRPAARRLPAENEVLGFDNNATFHRATPVLVEGYLALAEEVAARAVAERWDDIVPCDVVREGATTCGARFVHRFGRRAFRRPLTREELDAFNALIAEVKPRDGFEAAVRLTVQAFLQSPQFLYRLDEVTETDDGTPRPLDSYALASRLAYFLWASMPDDALLEVAQRGGLDTPEGVEAEVRRMLRDPRVQGAVRHFHRQWLGLAALDDLVKDGAGAHPGGLAGLREGLRESLHAFLERAFADEEDALAALFASPTLFLDAALGPLYGVEAGLGEAFTEVGFPETERAGLLTQPALLAKLAHADQTSPIRRGVFVRERILCQPLPPPPPDVVVEPPDPDPSATTRERFAEHTENASCQGCHVLIDPVGFGFEGYDELGRLRTEENGRPVDDSGELVGPPDSPITGPFRGAAELSRRLAESEAVRRCLVTHWFRYAMARGEQRADACTIDHLTDTFARGGTFESLLVAVATSDAFLLRAGAVAAPVAPVEPDPPRVEPDAGVDDGIADPPRGFLDGVDERGEARGWAGDPDDPRTPALVDLYLDGPAGEGLFLGGVRADQPRPDVTAAFPELSGDHGFASLLPEVARDGRDHTLHAYTYDDQDGTPTELAGSPLAFRAGLNANPPGEAEPPPDAFLPEGFLDHISAEGVVSGWALDRDVVGRPLEIHFYVDGPALAGGEAVGSTLTGNPRPDVNAAIGHAGDHGWRFQLPVHLFDGQPHTLYVYAFNAGRPGNRLLSNAPRAFTLEPRP